jgi:hypothetical protein
VKPLTLRVPSRNTVILVAACTIVLGLAIGAAVSASRTGAPSGASSTTSVGSSAATRTIAAYRGLGSWVDIYDAKAWKDPAAAVADMAANGVRTIYIETANSHSTSAFNHPVQIEQFIQEAHAHGMSIVAWYLPYLKSEALDLGRVTQAIQFRTADGQSFDSFALDIESSAVKPLSARIAALESLSAKIRAVAGPAYPLGGIIPSPVGLARKTGYWNDFPYAMVARYYDVILPMGYYTYHGKGAHAAHADAVGNIRIIRDQPGCASIPIHLIGGLAEGSNGAEVAAFAKAAGETGCIGASLYGWAGTSAAEWQALRVIAR